MIDAPHSKVQSRHLKRTAYLYVRQSTLRQVFENVESTKRQYALRDRATALGWPLEQVVVIDSDLGQSGASAADRAGFQRLVTEVGLGRAGIVMGLEVSRLARNSTDWHRLLEICALSDTLILDEDGIYDPSHFNDRLLLGLKGTMSEAELHVLKARLRGGIFNKARRGELEMRLPIGFVYDADQKVRLDVDARIRDTLHQLFDVFRRTGSATATVKVFRERNLLFPRRLYRGPGKGDVLWGELECSRVLWVLHHPRYAGAFCFGRTRQRKHPDGRHLFERLPREEWIALIPDAHEGYISWDDFEENLRRLRENAQALGMDRRGPPREGPALLQGLAICAVCGDRMTVRYHQHRGQRVPDYMCQRLGIERAEPVCQRVHGAALDQAIGEVLVTTLTPMTLEVALRVQQELETRTADTDRLLQRAVTQARYEADLARRRFLQVDPDNRLVADALEAEWNEKLRALDAAHRHYEQQRQAVQRGLNEEQRARILALATDFPRLWKDPRTPDRERKRMARLLLEDVTLLKESREVTAHLRFRGGATSSLKVQLPRPAWLVRQTPSEIVTLIDELLDEHTEGEIAQLLDHRGLRSGTGRRFRWDTVRRIRRAYGLRSRYERLRARGMLDQRELATRLGARPDTVKMWRRKGYVLGYAYNEKGQCLFPDPGPDAPVKWRHNKPRIARTAVA